MAGNDCEDCNKHRYAGGKCDRWEYNCPFSHLRGFNKEEQEKIDQDIKMVTEFKNKLNELINEYKDKFNDPHNYKEILQQLKFAYSNLEDMVSEELINEWKEINT
jgi:archaellum component FlaC